MSTSTTETVTHQRRRLTQEFRGLPSGTEFHTAANTRLGLTLAWSERDDLPPALRMSPVDDFLRETYDLPEEARSCMTMDRPDDISEVVEQAPAPEVATYPRYRIRSTSPYHPWPVGTEFNLLPDGRDDGSARAMLAEAAAGGWEVTAERASHYRFPEEYVGRRGRWVEADHVSTFADPVTDEPTEQDEAPAEAAGPLAVGSRRITTQRYGPWPAGTTLTVLANDDIGTLYVGVQDGGPSSHQRVSSEYPDWTTWHASAGILLAATRPAEEEAPTPVYYRVTDATLLPADWQGAKVWIDPEPNGTMWNYYAVDDGLGSGGAPPLTREQVEQYGLPERMVGRTGWRTRLNVRETLIPWVDEPEPVTEPVTEQAQVYRVPEHLTGDGYGSNQFPRGWAGKRVVVFGHGEGSTYISAFCEEHTSGGGRRLNEEERATVPWEIDADTWGWSITETLAQQIRDYPDTPPTVQAVRVRADRLQDFPAAWREQRLWQHPDTGMGNFAFYPLDNQGVEQGTGPQLTREFVREHGLPEGLVGFRGWTASSADLVWPTVEATAEPTPDLSAEVADLRRQIAEAQEQQAQKMREIATKGLEWGIRHGYEGSVESFLSDMGIEVDPPSREVTGEIVLRIHFSGILDEETDLEEVTRNWVARSFYADENYSGEDRADLLLTVDEDFDSMSFDSSLTLESVRLGDTEL